MTTGRDDRGDEAKKPMLLAYVRPMAESLEGAPALDEAIQRTAVRACARGEGLGTPEVFEEAEVAGRTAFGHIARVALEAWQEREAEALAMRGQPVSSRVMRTPNDEPLMVLVVATLAVLGEHSVERAWRLLLLEGCGVRVMFADGVPPQEALRGDWERRPEDERRRERAREAMRAKALRAQVLGRPPYGYEVVGKSLSPHPRESVVVQRMFREYVEEGEGLRRIAAGLNRDGIPTRLGRQWSPGSVRTVLRNPVYTGLYRRLGVTVTSAHPGLVDRGTFGVVQRRMVAKRTSRTEQERHEYLLGGLLRCGTCGSLMIGERRATESGDAEVVVAYRCERAANQGRCRAKSVREDAMVAVLREELGEATGQHPVAVRTVGRRGEDSRAERMERRLKQMIERWTGGEWSYEELVRRVAPTVRALQLAEMPMREPLPPADEARRQLVREWEALDFGERRLLLRAAVAEAVVERRGLRVTLRR